MSETKQQEHDRRADAGEKIEYDKREVGPKHRRSCETCEFFAELAEDSAERADGATGECRRRAKANATVTGEGEPLYVLAQWPLVVAGDWCGEWSRA